MFDYYNDEEIKLENALDKVSFTDGRKLDSLLISADKAGVKHYAVNMPDDEFAFLHEAAVYAYDGALFAAWYANRRTELTGETPIFYSRSFDGGKTWSKRKLLVTDPSGKILYCPPVFGEDGEKLYLFVNEMVAPDHMHAMRLYVFDRGADEFVLVGSRPTGFKLNTNVVRLPGGRLLLPGRVADVDCFPVTPAALISDRGKIEAEWRLVKLQTDGNLPLGHKLVFPEISAMRVGSRLFTFCRDDECRVPLVYVSDDRGESWSGPMSHDLPIVCTKIYSGELSDGRGYIVANLYNNEQVHRGKLAVLFTEKGSAKIANGIILHRENDCALFPEAVSWHYPCACEANGTLNIIYTAGTKDNTRRAALLSTIPLR